MPDAPPPAPLPSTALPTARIEDVPHVAFCLLDARGRVLAARDADRPFYAASTIKLHVLLAALRRADQGLLDLAAEVPATRTFRGHDGAPFTLDGDHLDPTHPEPGTPIAVGALLRRMIDRSSNEATDTVLELIGVPAVARTIADLGLRATRVERPIGDAAALAAGLTNETTAADLAQTLRALVRADGTPLTPASRTLAREALAAQRLRAIATELRADVPVGSKSGEVEGIRHDVAVLGDPDGEDARILAILTAGYELPQADELIRSLVRALLPELCADESDLRR